MSKFENLKNAKELKEYLDSVLSRKQPKYYYHYTKLSNLIAIYKNKTFKAAKIKDMNDRLEKDFARNCTDYFTCLMGSSIESFGMWAMYGGIGSHFAEEENITDAYVKIQIPFESIKTFVKESDGKITLRKIAYTNINAQLKKESKQATIFCGTLKNTNKIDCQDSILRGYVKDNAWAYEKEVRLVSKKEYIDISSIIDSFKVIPSPNNSIQECRLIFKNLKGTIKLDKDPAFEDNEYYNLIMNR